MTHRTLFGATTPRQSVPGSDGNEGVLCISQSSNITGASPSDCLVCREGENFVFWFGAQFNSTLNFTQSGWLILFTPDLHFRPPNRVSCQTQSLWLETPTSADVTLGVLHWRCFLAGQCRPVQISYCGSNSSSNMDTRGNPSNLWIPYEESQLNIN